MGSAKNKSAEGGWITVKSKSEARRSRDYAERARRETASDELSSRTKAETDASSKANASTPSRSLSPKSAEDRVDTRLKKQKRQKTVPKDIKIHNHLEAQDFVSAVSDAQDRYSDTADQLGAITDFLIAQYRGCELSFNRSVLEQPLDKATELPLAHVPPDVVQHALCYYRQQDLHLLAEAALRLIQAIFADLPLSARATPPKAKVGLLVSLALMLRAAPPVALLLSEDLLRGGSHFSSPTRLPFLLWTLNQAARSNAAVGVATWVRVLLPQILGAPLPAVTPQSSPAARSVPKLGAEGADRALGFLEALLRHGRPPVEEPELDERGLPRWHPGTVGLAHADSRLVRAGRQGIRMPAKRPENGRKSRVEPVVPPGELAAIAAATYGAAPACGAAKLRAQLHRQHEQLREIALAGCQGGGFSTAEAVRLLLDAAGRTQDAEVLEELAGEIIACLLADPAPAAAAWQAAHAQQLPGSSAVLQGLAADFPWQLQPPHAMGALRSTLTPLLQALQHAHSGLLGSGAQAAAAQRAEAACAQLLALLGTSKGRASPAPGTCARSTMLAIGAAAALAGLAAVQTEAGRLVIGDLAGSQLVAHASGTLATAWDNLQPLLRSFAQEAASVMGAAQHKAQPVLQQLSVYIADAASFAVDHTMLAQQALRGWL